MATVGDTQRAILEQLNTLTQRNEALALELGMIRERSAAQEKLIVQLRHHIQAVEVERNNLRLTQFHPAPPVPTTLPRPIMLPVGMPSIESIKFEVVPLWRRILTFFAHLDD